MVRLLRGSKISQAIMERQTTETRFAAADRSHWYNIEPSLLPEFLFALFQLSYLDPDTQDFLDTSTTTSGSYCLQMYYAVLTSMLQLFLSKTSINGVLNRGGMFLFSDAQLRDFLQIPAEWTPKGKRLLDLGAGDGGITQAFKGLFGEIYATEMSQVMQYRLRQHGFQIADVDKWPQENRKYDLIMALNLLDRHFNPRKLLADLHHIAVRDQCPVMLAVVLPVKQYVEFHPSKNTTTPDVFLSLRGTRFEDHVHSLVVQELMPAGFEVIRWTKLPYLCEGDFNKPYYYLFDAVFLLRAVPNQDSGHFQTRQDIIHEEL